MYGFQYKSKKKCTDSSIKVKRNVQIQYKGKKECTDSSIKVKRNVQIPV